MKRNVLFQKKTPGAETVQKFPHPIFFSLFTGCYDVLDQSSRL